MGKSGKEIFALLVGGGLYAILKLGDELAVVFDEILRAFDESLLLKLSINDIVEGVAEVELSFVTIVLGLLAVFLLLAVVDYVSTEM